MVHAVEELLLVQVRHQARQVVATPLDLHVLPLREVVDADVQLVATRQAAGHFLAHEEIGVPAKSLCGVDRVVIGDRNQIHSPAFQPGVNRFRRCCSIRGKTLFRTGSVHMPEWIVWT